MDAPKMNGNVKLAAHQRELAYGVYEATERFRAIDLHSCVCFKDNMDLIAVTGDANDVVSQAWAEKFAMVDDLALALLMTSDLLWQALPEMKGGPLYQEVEALRAKLDWLGRKANYGRVDATGKGD